MNSLKEWFLIQSVLDGSSTLSCDRTPLDDYTRSQVYVYPTPEYTDAELWRWNGNYLQNKKSGLVLDIRKGRLRLIEDTEICLFQAKSLDDAGNQQWGIRSSRDEYGRETPGVFIYTLSNEEWVVDLNIHSAGSANGAKLVLYPAKDFDNNNQLWAFTPAEIALTTPDTSPTANTETNDDDILAETRRRSQSSTNSQSAEMTLETLKECHHKAYLENDPHLSNRTIGMAAAYYTIMQWKLSAGKPDPALFGNSISNELQWLQAFAAKQASSLFDKSDTLSSDRSTAAKIAVKVVTQLHSQLPLTP
ncbi:hypothetical protein INT43_003247 [Umbelopsis isabellina]|uniref:Ricin B lectin domain-containing protein n=1 Tax=Mortierella isabellina TaxID=91625 RepID=A0A8H7PR62_MORIS|nr:hypothetical protein INT43_003247 [Umbelopsis isabellina]